MWCCSHSLHYRDFLRAWISLLTSYHQIVSHFRQPCLFHAASGRTSRALRTPVVRGSDLKVLCHSALDWRLVWTLFPRTHSQVLIQFSQLRLRRLISPDDLKARIRRKRWLIHLWKPATWVAAEVSASLVGQIWFQRRLGFGHNYISYQIIW